MEIGTEEVLKKLKEISAKHLYDNPAIGIDSLSLALNVPPNTLIPLLMQLKAEQQVALHRAENTRQNRSNGRIDDYNQVSLL